MEMCFRKLGVWSLVNGTKDEETTAATAAIVMDTEKVEADEDFSW